MLCSEGHSTTCAVGVLVNRLLMDSATSRALQRRKDFEAMANAVDAQLLERRVERVLALAARERDEHGHLHLLRLKAREVPLEPERSEQLLDGTGRAPRTCCAI